MSDFHRTVMGYRFYENTMPELVVQLRRLNDNIEKLPELVRQLEQLVNQKATKEKDR